MTRTIEFVPRIIHGNYDTPERLRGVIGFCKTIGIKEVQLCPVKASVEPAWLARPGMVKRRRELARIIRTLEKNGIEGTINILRVFLPIPRAGEEHTGYKQGRMDMAGKLKEFTPCPLDRTYRDYMRFFFAEMARTGATKLFVDDDFRYEYLGMGPTCFCPLHVREFNRRCRRKETRESLAAACESEKPGDLKRDWMLFKRDLLVELAAEWREVVHAVNPQVRLGLMLTSTEISLPDACDQRQLVDTFAGNLQPLCRPGMGWYADAKRTEILEGLTDSVFHASLMSKDTEIQAEVDLYPHTRFNKSTDAGLGYQIKALLACNIKKQSLWPFEERHQISASHPYAAILKRNMRSFRAITGLIPDTAVMQGVKVVYNHRMAALVRPQRAQDVKVYGPAAAVQLWRLGIPYTFGESPAVFLTKDSFPMTRREALAYLEECNCFIDGEALEQLASLGLRNRLGVRQGRPLAPSERLAEEIVDSPLNGSAQGGRARSALGGGRFSTLQRKDRAWKVLSHLTDGKGKRVTPGVVARERNGRRTVIANYAFKANTFWLDETKQAQLQGLLTWLHGGALPAAVIDAPDVCPVVLEDAASKTRVVSLINTSTALVQGFPLRVQWRGAARAVRVEFVTEDGTIIPVPRKFMRKRGRALEIIVPPAAAISPYQVRVFRLSPSR